MQSFQHGRVIIATTALANMSADALIVPRLVGANSGDSIYDAVITAGGEELAQTLALEAVASDGPILTAPAVGLRADSLIVVMVDAEAQRGGAALELSYDNALRKAFETGALSIALPLFLGGQDDDAAGAVAVIAAFIEAHPSIEQVTLVAEDERSGYRALAAAGEYL